MSNVRSIRLSYLEKKIAPGMGSFIETLGILGEIRDRRLYRDTHDTFEDFVKERFGEEVLKTFNEFERYFRGVTP